MEKQKQKLELTWIGKEKRPRLEPRVLVEDAAKSHHAATRRRNGKDIFDNMLIHGDNLLALKALEQQFAGKVKCIYIDPPYNTGNAFEHYDDGLEHSIWLGLMRERLNILWNLLSSKGSIWISIDDSEQAYMRVLCDELFGRENFIAQIVWQKRYSRENREAIGDAHEYIIVYAKNPLIFKSIRNLVPMSEEQAAVYKNPNKDPKGRWRPVPMTAQAGHATPEQFYEITAPSGKVFTPPSGRCWSLSRKTFDRLLSEGRIWFGKNGNSQPNTIRYLSDVSGVAPWTWWPSSEVGHTDSSKKEILSLFGKDKIFDTPKPESLMQRILHIATNAGDLVLDSFLGSGTTAAVAHKMGRRWIGVELCDHCYTHCKVRLDKVIDGTDAGGITKAVGWKGGGGYRFFELAPTLIKEDAYGQKIMNPEYDAEKLARGGVCKLEGFTYAPSESEYFIHGHSTERDYIYVTTNYLKAEHLRALSELVGPERSLLICCKGFSSGVKLPNLTVKKIPKAVLDKCEYGHDDYSLNVKNLPMAAPEYSQSELFD